MAPAGHTVHVHCPQTLSQSCIGLLAHACRLYALMEQATGWNMLSLSRIADVHVYVASAFCKQQHLMRACTTAHVLLYLAAECVAVLTAQMPCPTVSRCPVRQDCCESRKLSPS